MNRVRTFLSVFVLAISLLWMATLEFLPHHHHGGLPCFVVEWCAHDGEANDEHTGHHELPGDGQEDHCMLHSLHYYLTSQQQHHIATPQLLLHLFAAGTPSYSIVPLYTYSVSLLPAVMQQWLPQPVIHYQALRAPPACMC